MEAIFFENGTYVVIKHDIETETNDSSLIISDGRNGFAILYGGRVNLQYSTWPGRGITFIIDGIMIQRFYPADTFMGNSDRLSFTETAAYLNQIEQLGVDSFLENYKKEVEALKTELKEYANTLRGDLAEKEDESKHYLLRRIENIIVCSLIPLLFSLTVNMNAGIDNYVYQEAYDNVVNTYFAD